MVGTLLFFPGLGCKDFAGGPGDSGFWGPGAPPPPHHHKHHHQKHCALCDTWARRGATVFKSYGLLLR